MRLDYDAEADVLTLILSARKPAYGEGCHPDVVLHLDEEGRIVMIEVQDASRHAPRSLNRKARELPRGHTLRGEVIKRWRLAGEPLWDQEHTIKVCEQVDKDFEHQGNNPAPKFRRSRAENNLGYVKTWVMGSHFPWVNPRF